MFCALFGKVSFSVTHLFSIFFGGGVGGGGGCHADSGVWLHARTWLFFKSTSGQKPIRLVPALVPATIYIIEEQQSDE